MMHSLLELLPFVAGGAYGLVTLQSGWRRLWPNLFVGLFGAAFAGELTLGPVVAAGCLAEDSAAALAGCLLVRFAWRLVARRQL